MQIDYAKEAVKQGSTSLALKSRTHVVSDTFTERISDDGTPTELTN